MATGRKAAYVPFYGAPHGSSAMNRRDFLATGFGAVAAGAAAEGAMFAEAPAGDLPPPVDIPGHPRNTKLNVKPVMANLIHTGVWQGPCRWTSATPEVERANAERAFADWSKRLKEKGLGRAEDVHLLEPAHVTFSEDWRLKPDQIAKLAPDAPQTDAFFLIPSGNSRSSFEIGDMFKKPIVLDGLSCRNIDIAALTLAKGNEVHLAGAPGQRLQAQGTAAGKQVQATGAFHIEHQPVEQGLAETVQGRAQALAGTETQATAAPLAANDAHFTAAAGCRGFASCRFA